MGIAIAMYLLGGNAQLLHATPQSRPVNAKNLSGNRLAPMRSLERHRQLLALPTRVVTVHYFGNLRFQVSLSGQILAV